MNFNSHAHVERDEKIRVDLPKATISTHTLTWSVTPPFDVPLVLRPYFNSHAHVERDHTHYRVLLTLNISTHTLTWSVTFQL